jgi:sulfur-oxidizing protein SoxX
MTTSRLLICLLITTLSGLHANPAEKGFRFPAGEAEAGREAFIKLNCIQCHSVAKTELPTAKPASRLQITLGSKLIGAKKYEDIIYAITNPKHFLTERYRDLLSKTELQGSIEPLMPDLTKDMSARQLMDIVTFLDSVYRKEQPEYGK